MDLKKLLQIARTNMVTLTDVADPDFRLEQAEFNTKETVWEIIVSFLVENTNKKESPLNLSSVFQYHRIYKKVKIKPNGEFIGFYMYNNK